MKCKYCGEKIGRHAKFCRFCGQERQPKKRKGLIWLIAGLMLAAVLVIAVTFAPSPVNDIRGIDANIQVKTGETVTLNPELKPERHKETEVQYEIADEKIAKAEENGTITGIKPGSTKLTITAGKCSKIYTVEVIASITAIKGVDKTIRIQRGETLTLKPKLTPEEYKDEKIEYIMENKEIATVSTEGVITAIKTGTSKLTIRAGGCEFETTVTVTAPPSKAASPRKSTYPKSGGNSTREYTDRNAPTTSPPPTEQWSTTEHRQPTQPEEIEDGEWL